MKIGLRGRLVLWYLLTIPALIFGLVFIAQQVVVVSLREQVDYGLRERAELTAEGISSAVRDNPESYTQIIEELADDQFPSIPQVLRVSDRQGNILATFGEVPDPIVTRLNSLLASAKTEEGEFNTISVKGEQALRVYTVALESTSPTVPVVVIQTGDSLSHIAAVESRMWLYGLSVGAVGTVVVLAMGFVILHRGFRPLNRILSRVQEIGHGNLGEGLPLEPRPPELQQLADSLNSMWRRLEEAFNARESFFASVSHDLRTPLTAIQGHVDVLLMKSSLGEETEDSLKRIAREVRRLVRMTDDLLLNAQLESNFQLRRQPVNLRQLLEEVVADVWRLSDDLELNLPAQEDVLVWGDYDLLEVADAGIGIPPKDLPRIIEPFYRSEASRRSVIRGTGLGLAIVERVVKLHDGRLEIDSRVGVGTTLQIMLPSLAGDGLTDGAEHFETSAVS